MRVKPNSFNSLRLAVQFLSDHASDYRQAPQYLPRFADARLEEDQLVWGLVPYSLRRSSRSHLKPSFQRIPNNLYLRFAELSERTDKHILAFAGKWGPLRGRAQSESEPISDWHYFSRLAAALLRAAVALAGGPSCHQDHWTIIGEWAYKNAISLRPDGDKYLLLGGIAASLNRWQDDPAIHQALVSMVRGRIQIERASDGLFSALVAQLACVISNTHRIAICSACGHGFFPKRIPSRGMRQYCPRTKCKQVAESQAALNYRHRKKAASKTAGVPARPTGKPRRANSKRHAPLR
jgi:hypothetical protein